MKYYTPKEIRNIGGDLLTCDDDRVRELIEIALSRVPAAVARAIMEQCRVELTCKKIPSIARSRLVHGTDRILLPKRWLDESQETIVEKILYVFACYHLGCKGSLSTDHLEAGGERSSVRTTAVVEEWKNECMVDRL